MARKLCPACGERIAPKSNRCKVCAFNLIWDNYPYFSEDYGPPDTWDDGRRPDEGVDEKTRPEYF